MTRTLASQVIDAAKAKSFMITAAESCTGGMISAAITSIAGSSNAFDRGFVTYTNEAKQDMLGVAPKSLLDFGAVSEQVAREMADGALKASTAGVAVSVTGIAGPGGSETKPEGRVCFGLALEGTQTHSETIEFGPLGRDTVRKRTVEHALTLLLNALK